MMINGALLSSIQCTHTNIYASIHIYNVTAAEEEEEAFLSKEHRTRKIVGRGVRKG